MKQWSTKEVKIIKKYYDKCSADQLIVLLSPRSWLSIYKKAKKLNLNYLPNRNNLNWNWTKNEIKKLKKIYPNQTESFILKSLLQNIIFQF